MSSSAPWLKLPKVRVAADSKLCGPLASFRPRRIPNLASLIAVPYDASLTVVLYDSCFELLVLTISLQESRESDVKLHDAIKKAADLQKSNDFLQKEMRALKHRLQGESHDI